MTITKLDSSKVKEWMKDTWKRYASASSFEGKLLTFDVCMDGRVWVRHGKTVYKGYDLEIAIEYFNNLLPAYRSSPPISIQHTS